MKYKFDACLLDDYHNFEQVSIIPYKSFFSENTTIVWLLQRMAFTRVIAMRWYSPITVIVVIAR